MPLPAGYICLQRCKLHNCIRINRVPSVGLRFFPKAQISTALEQKTRNDMWESAGLYPVGPTLCVDSGFCFVVKGPCCVPYWVILDPFSCFIVKVIGLGSHSKFARSNEGKEYRWVPVNPNKQYQGKIIQVRWVSNLAWHSTHWEALSLQFFRISHEFGKSVFWLIGSHWQYPKIGKWKKNEIQFFFVKDMHFCSHL